MPTRPFCPEKQASLASRTKALIACIYGPSETWSFGTHVHLAHHPSRPTDTRTDTRIFADPKLVCTSAVVLGFLSSLPGKDELIFLLCALHWFLPLRLAACRTSHGSAGTEKISRVAKLTVTRKRLLNAMHERCFKVHLLS
jgi:hypothetical protein